MATSKCAKCDSTRFEMKENTPSGTRLKMQFIQCASCGAVVGTTDYYNVPLMLKELAEKMGFNLLT